MTTRKQEAIKIRYQILQKLISNFAVKYHSGNYDDELSKNQEFLILPIEQITNTAKYVSLFSKQKSNNLSGYHDSCKIVSTSCLTPDKHHLNRKLPNGPRKLLKSDAENDNKRIVHKMKTSDKKSVSKIIRCKSTTSHPLTINLNNKQNISSGGFLYNDTIFREEECRGLSSKECQIKNYENKFHLTSQAGCLKKLNDNSINCIKRTMVFENIT